MNMNRTNYPSKVGGTSLVELMVGMLIGLIGIIIISHLYLKNEQYKRSTSGSGTAQVNGAIALYTLERDVRMAGFGVNHSAALGCSCAGAGCSTVQYHYNGTYSYPPAGAAGGALAPLVFAPVFINDNTGSPDTITVLYGSDPERVMPTTLTEAMPSAAAQFKVDGNVGFDTGDLVLVASGSSCALSQVTGILSGALQHAPGSSALWNPAGTSSLPTFAQGASVFNLGNPTWRAYSIASGSLVSTDVLTVPGGGTGVPLVQDIVDMQAQYGKDDGGSGGMVNDGVVDTWNANPPTTATQWQQVLAIRVALLARSPNYEKPEPPSTTCTATVSLPSWEGSGATSGVLTVPGGLPSCHKFRVFETVIPLRNMIWRPA
jgi:type IV pilus assembly protein PilW